VSENGVSSNRPVRSSQVIRETVIRRAPAAKLPEVIQDNSVQLILITPKLSCGVFFKKKLNVGMYILL